MGNEARPDAAIVNEIGIHPDNLRPEYWGWDGCGWQLRTEDGRPPWAGNPIASIALNVDPAMKVRTVRGLATVLRNAVNRAYRAAEARGDREPAPLQPPPPPSRPGFERAEWIGRQLDVLATDNRAAPQNVLGGRAKDLGHIEQRRYAWGMYLWARSGEGRMPDLQKSGDGFNAYPLPGSVELHLEGLNRLAHEELGDE